MSCFPPWIFFLWGPYYYFSYHYHQHPHSRHIYGLDFVLLSSLIIYHLSNVTCSVLTTRELFETKRELLKEVLVTPRYQLRGIFSIVTWYKCKCLRQWGGLIIFFLICIRSKDRTSLELSAVNSFPREIGN